jgi:DNA repair/transcription protein MET18/MMS19
VVHLQKLREASLKCIGVLPRAVRYDILHPHKLVVIKKLAKALDDPKRDVRREAVHARCVTLPATVQ